MLIISVSAWLSACGGSPEADEEITYVIGDTGPAGGIVFQVSDGGLHGFEVAPVDQAPLSPLGAEWGCYLTMIPGADGTDVGTGAQNTIDILASCTTAGIAAILADAYLLNGFNDWFLPSKDELNEMYLNIGPGSVPPVNVGGFADGTYWSSSEISGKGAWAQDFDFVGGGGQGGGGKTNNDAVRVVRAF